MRLKAGMIASLVLICCCALPVTELVAQTAGPKKDVATLSALSSSFQALAERVSPAVVQIMTTGYGALAGGPTSGDFVAMQRGRGSGVILDRQGYIVTNGHVVEGARRVQVLLALPADAKSQWRSILKPEGNVVPATIVGIDRETDLAVLKIEEKDLRTLELGDSDALRSGQIVMAFGSPLGLENSVTMGVVSSAARQLRPDDPMIYIQTDASINPGNSGGPLVDTDGRVVGLNTFILTRSGGSEGIGFAAPSNIVRYVFDQIRQHGHVHRGQIGAEAQTVTPTLAKGLGLAQDWGVILSDVAPRGAADVTGLKIGDMVLALNGKVMENARQFDVNLYQHAVGTIVNLEVLRGFEKLTKGVTVLERANDPDRFADLVTRETNLVPKLGILAATLDGRFTKMLSPLRNLSGVVVTSRVVDSPARGDAFAPGDVIYSLNRAPVRDLEGLQSALADLQSGDAAVLQVERQGKLMYIPLVLE